VALVVSICLGSQFGQKPTLALKWSRNQI